MDFFIVPLCIALGWIVGYNWKPSPLDVLANLRFWLDHGIQGKIDGETSIEDIVDIIKNKAKELEMRNG